MPGYYFQHSLNRHDNSKELRAQLSIKKIEYLTTDIKDRLDFYHKVTDLTLSTALQPQHYKMARHDHMQTSHHVWVFSMKNDRYLAR